MKTLGWLAINSASLVKDIGPFIAMDWIIVKLLVISQVQCMNHVFLTMGHPQSNTISCPELAHHWVCWLHIGHWAICTRLV